MSTSGHVFYEKNPGIFEGVCVHFDAYLTRLGSTLFTAYNEQHLVEKLINLGSLSSIDILCDPPPKYQSLSYIYNDDHPPVILGYSLAYHRDYHQPKESNLIAYSLEEIAQKFQRPYVWSNNEWHYLDIEANTWKKIKDSLELISEFNPNYVLKTQVWEEKYSHEQFLNIIKKGFLFTADKKYEVGHYINFFGYNSDNPKEKYQLLLRIIEDFSHEAITPEYRLLILSKPPKDLAWYSPL